jgi:hypothetical protein
MATSRHFFHEPLAPQEAHAVAQLCVGKLADFLQGASDCVCVETDGRHLTGAAPPPLLVPGAFNPVHEGHWSLAAAAARCAGKPAAFELCVANVDKPPLGTAAVCHRLRQFAWRAPVWVTRAPRFVEKARLFLGTIFAVGADTAARILAPRYYAEAEAGLAKAMAEVRRRGCRFLVACRAEAGGDCVQLEDLNVPADYGDLFIAIPPDEFRLDVSSTELRSIVTTRPPHGRPKPQQP